MNINPKLIAEIVIGITGVIGLCVFCKKTSLSKNTESTLLTGNSTEEPDSFSDSFISENAAQAEADFVNTINTIRLNKLFVVNKYVCNFGCKCNKLERNEQEKGQEKINNEQKRQISAK